MFQSAQEIGDGLLSRLVNMKGLRIYFGWKPSSPAVCGRNWLKGAFLCVGLIGVGLVAFLSLRASPAISTVRWMPRVVATWADRHGRFCNFPAYGIIGVPFFMISSGMRRQLGIILILAVFLTMLELTQKVIPSRVCDFWDIFWGSAGLVAAWAICEVLKRFRITIGSKPLP